VPHAALRARTNDDGRIRAKIAPMIEPAPVKVRRGAEKAAAAAAAIERAADRATEELAVLQAEVAARDEEIGRLLETCDDRQKVIAEIGEQAAAYRRAAEGRAALVAALEFDLEHVRREHKRAERERNDALAAAELATHALDDERRRATLAAHEHDAALRNAQRETESLRTRAEMLDTALTARAHLVDDLQTACDARMTEVTSLTREIDALRLVAEERQLLLDANEAANRARLADMERLTREIDALRQVAEERRLLLDANEAAYRARDAHRAAHTVGAPDDGTDWRAIADERERALQDVSAEAERRAVLLAEVTAALDARGREVEDLRKRLARTS
jgi:chromosome segregation ATPase